MSLYVQGLVKNVYMRKPYFDAKAPENAGKPVPPNYMVVQLETNTPLGNGGEGHRFELKDFNIKKKSDEAEYSALQGKTIMLPFQELKGENGIIHYTDSTRRPILVPETKK